MSARRTVRLASFSLETPPSLNDSEAFYISDTGYLGVHVMVDVAAPPAAVGKFALYVSGDGEHYVRCSDADSGLERTLTDGTNALDTMAALDATPSQYGKLVYVGDGGGGGASTARVFVTVG